MASKNVDVILASGSKESLGSIELKLWGSSDAIKRASLCFGLIYVMGMVAEISPFFHFFLPPLWIVVGPYVAKKVYEAYHGSVELKRGRGICPNCDAATAVFPHENQFPFSSECKGCGAALVGEPQSAECFAATLKELRAKEAEAMRVKVARLPKILQAPLVLNNLWPALFYASLIVFSLFCLLSLTMLGELFFAPPPHLKVEHPLRIPAGLGHVGHLLLAFIVIVVVAKAFGALFKIIKQPPVMGEVVAGLFLGPSFLKAFAPQVVDFVFPASVTSAISALAQLGIVIFMFVIGVELDTKLLRSKAHASVAISHGSIILPFLCGVFLALFLYGGFAPTGTSFSVFSMFLGVAMSITAFPVLARILSDLRLVDTQLGNVVLTCAAVDDVTAWCLLAAVTGFAKANLSDTLTTFVLTITFSGVLLYFGKAVIRRIAERTEQKGFSQDTLVVMCLLMLASAFVTELIGIHALFGAFLLGALVPKDSLLATSLVTRLSSVVLVILLPAFFAYTGLRTEIGLLNSLSHWVWCLIIIAVASLGKVGGAAIAARLNGFNAPESLGIGALMNTRGLMELVVLNIGLDMGVMTPTLFTIFVIMAIVTTLTATPLFLWLTQKRAVLAKCPTLSV